LPYPRKGQSACLTVHAVHCADRADCRDRIARNGPPKQDWKGNRVALLRTVTTCDRRALITQPSFPYGSPVDFDRLFRRLYPSLFRYLYRLTGDPDTADDIAQESFSRLLRHALPEAEAKPWLFTVATNLV